MRLNNNFHILIVDDEKLNIELAAVYLKEEGYKISYATNGDSAIKAVLEKNIDIILLDINMPEMDGFEVCKILKGGTDTKSIPIIFLTAQTDIEYISKAFEIGGIDYITKPFNGIELKARVKTHLKNLAYLEEIKRKQDKFVQLSITDSLTKLYNSLYFDSQIKTFQKQEKEFWFIYIKLNRFDRINTLYGFAKANKILKIFSKILKESALKNSVVARLHGVSFAVLTKNYDTKTMRDFYNNIILKLSKNEELSKSLSVSIVFLNCSNYSEPISSLYRKAQKGVDHIEANGGRYQFIN